jgi:hypothetical protein
MPVWLDVALNLVGYAGFLALAARSSSRSGNSNDGHICDDNTRALLNEPEEFARQF